MAHDNKPDKCAGDAPGTWYNSPGTIDYVVATLPVFEDRVLLVWHRALNRWLPPGGHIERNETPDEAAVREVREEVGLTVDLIDDSLSGNSFPNDVRPLARPLAVRYESIAVGHAHVDFVYAAWALTHQITLDQTSLTKARWFGCADLLRDESLEPDLRALARLAIHLAREKVRE